MKIVIKTFSFVIYFYYLRNRKNEEEKMISKGQTIVYKVSESHYMFYWLCDIQDEYLVFFNWYGNPYKATSTDFWKISNKWFNEKLEEGKLEVYDSLPLEKYGDIFEQQAVLMNNK